MIQGIVSLNDEDTSNYIIILAGLHKHLAEWWKRVEERNLASDGDIHRIEDIMYTKTDVMNFQSS